MGSHRIKRGFEYLFDEAARVVAPFAAEKSERMKQDLEAVRQNGLLRPGSLAASTVVEIQEIESDEK